MKKLMIVLCLVVGTQVSFGQAESKTAVQPKDSKTTPQPKGSNEKEQPKKEKLTVEQRAEKRTANMDANLKLTPDQRGKIYEINLNTIKRNDGIRQNKSLTDVQRDEQIKASSKDRWNQIETILTPDQKKLVKEKKIGEKDTPETEGK